MGKISGLEEVRDIPSKVLLMYEAVEQLIVEGVDLNTIRVSTITDKAGIGKGTAYDYFDTKEDILACAVIFYIRKAMEELNNALAAYDSFLGQVDFLLREIGKGSNKHQCMLRYIHMMTDTSCISRMVQERIHMMEAERYLLAGILARMLEKGMKRGEVRKDIPIDYMVYVLFSKILSYILCVFGEGFATSEENRIHSFVYQSIVNELCEKNV